MPLWIWFALGGALLWYWAAPSANAPAPAATGPAPAPPLTSPAISVAAEEEPTIAPPVRLGSGGSQTPLSDVDSPDSPTLPDDEPYDPETGQPVVLAPDEPYVAPPAGQGWLYSSGAWFGPR
jgi:hypothetical protein